MSDIIKSVFKCCWNIRIQHIRIVIPRHETMVNLQLFLTGTVDGIQTNSHFLWFFYWYVLFLLSLKYSSPMPIRIMPHFNSFRCWVQTTCYFHSSFFFNRSAIWWELNSIIWIIMALLCSLDNVCKQICNMVLKCSYLIIDKFNNWFIYR